jgi:predicted nucleic acid-binding protein
MGRAIFAPPATQDWAADAIIAATALVHDLSLVMRNINDFKHVAGLRIINPFEAT